MCGDYFRSITSLSNHKTKCIKGKHKCLRCCMHFRNAIFLDNHECKIPQVFARKSAPSAVESGIEQNSGIEQKWDISQKTDSSEKGENKTDECKDYGSQCTKCNCRYNCNILENLNHFMYFYYFHILSKLDIIKVSP